MSAGRCDLVVDQGEDWTVQIIWSDYYDNPMNVIAPMRLTIKSQFGAVIRELTVPTTPPASGEIAAVSYNSESGLIQLHMPKDQTAALNAGVYNYDLFVTVDDGTAYAGNQVQRLLYGNITVNLRYGATL